MLALVFGVALAAPTTGGAQQDSRWERQVRERLHHHADQLAARGYHPSHDPHTGLLDQQETEELTLTLKQGTAYAVLGVCDEDCTDVDLRIFDRDGRELGADVRHSDAATVELVPERTGTYRVRVIMAGCAVSPCWFGVGVYSK